MSLAVSQLHLIASHIFARLQPSRHPCAFHDRESTVLLDVPSLILMHYHPHLTPFPAVVCSELEVSGHIRARGCKCSPSAWLPNYLLLSAFTPYPTTRYESLHTASLVTAPNSPWTSKEIGRVWNAGDRPSDRRHLKPWHYGYCAPCLSSVPMTNYLVSVPCFNAPNSPLRRVGWHGLPQFVVIQRP